ncbi:MAG: CHAD domain-containing protein [Limisphaerales bacterium]
MQRKQTMPSGNLFTLTLEMLDETLTLASPTSQAKAPSTRRIRVNTKMLRSRHRLCATLLTPISFRKARARSSEISQLLSPRRDSEVVVKTLFRVRCACKKNVRLGGIRRLQALFEDQSPEAVDAWHWVRIRQLLRLERDFWRRLVKAHSAPPTDCLASGLVQTYRKAHRMYDRARHQRDCQRFHEWRKWVKYLYYQSQCLISLGLPAKQDRTKVIKRLGRCLGQHHDLDVLRSHINRLPVSAMPSDKLASWSLAIARIEKEHESKALKMAKPLFKSNPERMVEGWFGFDISLS